MSNDSMKRTRGIDPVALRRLAYVVAGELGVDVRSVLKELRGEHVRGLAGERIRARLASDRAA